jgi:hypothetical protein
MLNRNIDFRRTLSDSEPMAENLTNPEPQSFRKEKMKIIKKNLGSFISAAFFSIPGISHQRIHPASSFIVLKNGECRIERIDKKVHARAKPTQNIRSETDGSSILC